jgi:hypothetical protein
MKLTNNDDGTATLAYRISETFPESEMGRAMQKIESKISDMQALMKKHYDVQRETGVKEIVIDKGGKVTIEPADITVGPADAIEVSAGEEGGDAGDQR